jgi:hypothetical protein
MKNQSSKISETTYTTETTAFFAVVKPSTTELNTAPKSISYTTSAAAPPI